MRYIAWYFNVPLLKSMEISDSNNSSISAIRCRNAISNKGISACRIKCWPIGIPLSFYVHFTAYSFNKMLTKILLHRCHKFEGFTHQHLSQNHSVGLLKISSLTPVLSFLIALHYEYVLSWYLFRYGASVHLCESFITIYGIITLTVIAW